MYKPGSDRRGGSCADPSPDKDQIIAGLIESNDILQEELNRLRNSNRVLRTVHRALRATLESQRAQLELAKFNDEVFKSFCDGGFSAMVAGEAEGGLPEAESVVEPEV